MKKRVLLLAVSCKKGGLCPGGIDLDNPQNWIRIVRDDGQAGAVQGFEIDFAKPLDVIEFDGRPMPQGKQRENWVIDGNSCRKIGSRTSNTLEEVYNGYGYHGFWGNWKSFLNEEEFECVNAPSESILKVTDVRIYKNDNKKAKIDFTWKEGSKYPLKWISMTDQEFYGKISDGNEVHFDNAYIVISIPKSIDDWMNSETGEKRAYKFVSKVFEIHS